MSSCAASCCTYFPKASCAFGTSASWPTAGGPPPCHFVFSCWARHRKPSKRLPLPRTQLLFGSAPSVADHREPSKGLLLPRSKFVLPRPSPLLPHETTLYTSKSLRVSARSVSLCLVVLQTAPFCLLKTCLRDSFALS